MQLSRAKPGNPASKIYVNALAIEIRNTLHNSSMHACVGPTIGPIIVRHASYLHMVITLI